MRRVSRPPDNTLMERETKILETPADKYQVKVFTYITGREKREIMILFSDKTKNEIALLNEATDKAINLMVVEVKDKENKILENKVNAVLDMKAEDYDFVDQELREIYFPNTKKKLKDGNPNI